MMHLTGFLKVKITIQNINPNITPTNYSTKETNGNIALDMEKEQVKLPKFGWVKVKFSKKQLQLFKEKGFNGKIKGATVSIHSNGQTYISLKIEEVVALSNEIDWTTVPLDEIIGCDLGLTHFLIDSQWQ